MSDYSYRKINEYSFRELDRKFVYIKDSEELLNIIRSNENIKDFEIIEPYFGYFYIDHINGLRMDIFANDTKGNLLISNSRITIEYPAILKYNPSIQVVNDIELVDGVVDTYNIFYKNINLVKTRDFEWLDEYRHNGNPDDVLATVIIDGKGKEDLWVRITGYDEKEMLLKGTLLNNSFINELLNKDKEVGLEKLGDYLRIILL